MRELLIIVLCTLIPISHYASQIPLTYDVASGAYLVFLQLGNSESIPFVVDTGSSNLTVIGDSNICSNCKMGSAYKRFSDNDQTMPLKKQAVKISYAKGHGSVKLYRGRVGIAGTSLSVDSFIFGVFTSGVHLNNIMGLAYPALSRPRGSALPTVFWSLNDRYHYNRMYSLLLCGNSGQSAWILGKPLLIGRHTTAYHLPLANKGFFSVFHFGISDKDGHTVNKLYPRTSAIIDSGTTGQLVYPERYLAPLLVYLKNHMRSKQRLFSEKFWQSRLCVNEASLEINNWPTLYFHFFSTQGNLLRVPLSPRHYLSSVGCATGWRRLAFVSSNRAFRYQPESPLKRAAMKNVILGTPFLEQYYSQFNMGRAGEIILSDNEALCVIDG